MHKTVSFLFLVSALLFCGHAAAGTADTGNQISSFSGAYDGNHFFTFSYKCTYRADANLTLFDVNGEPDLNFKFDCNSMNNSYSLRDINFQSGNMLMAKFDINKPCAVCSRTVFIYAGEKVNPESVPDNSVLLALGLLLVATLVLRKKK